MAIRRPGISSPEWLFQDFLYQTTPEGEERYIQVKWCGEVYTKISQSFDYSDPPYEGAEQRGGDIAAQLDYSLVGNLVTVTGWDVNWRDEWPLRLAFNYLNNCLYPLWRDFLIRVVEEEVYTQSGQPVSIANTHPYAFLVSEDFEPVTNDPHNYLLR